MPRNQRELAQRLGICIETLRHYKAAGAPIGSRGPYDLDSIRQWIGEHLPGSKVAIANDGTPTNAQARLLDAQLRKEVALARLAELQVARFEERGGGCPPEGCGAADLVERLETMLEEVAPRLAKAATPNACRAILQDALGQVRHELGQDGLAVAGNDGFGPWAAAAAAPATDSRRGRRS